MAFRPRKGEQHGNLTRSHRHAPKQERAVAKRLNARLTKGSGAGEEKGDCRVKGVARIECKCTSKKSFSVTREMIDKIEMAACSAGELPMIEIQFLDDRGKVTHTCAVVPSYAIDYLVERAARDVISEPVEDAQPLRPARSGGSAPAADPEDDWETRAAIGAGR